MVREKFKVTGSVPFEWMPSTAALSNISTMSKESLSLNGYPENIFEIDDVTGDAEADATFGVPFIIAYGYFRPENEWGNHQLDDWAFGFKKTGAGTMRIAAAKYWRTAANTVSGLHSCNFNGDAKVNEGTLQIDGDISLSDTVRVAAGAYLSGTGVVNNVALASGGGLRVPSRQKNPLRAEGNLTVAGDLVVAVDLLAGASVQDVKADVLTVAGSVTGGGNVAGATVLVNGVATPAVVARLQGSTLSVRFLRGTSVIIR